MSTVKLTQSISETYPGSSLTGAVIVTLKAADFSQIMWSLSSAITSIN